MATTPTTRAELHPTTRRLLEELRRDGSLSPPRLAAWIDALRAGPGRDVLEQTAALAVRLHRHGATDAAESLMCVVIGAAGSSQGRDLLVRAGLPGHEIARATPQPLTRGLRAPVALGAGLRTNEKG